MVRPLVKKDWNGVPYVRPRAIEAALDLAIQQDPTCLSQHAWEVDQDAPGFLPLECLVHLIRNAWRRGDETTMNLLMTPLLARCERILKAKIRTDETRVDAAAIREDILSDFSLLFVEDGSEDHADELDYFECRFNHAFQCFRITRLLRETKRLQLLDPLTAQDEAPPSSEEKPVRRLPEVPSSPASQVDGIFRNQRLQAINNLPPDERKAVILCGVFGYKEESDDPTIVTAATLCGVTGRTIRNRLRRAAARLSHFKEEL